MTSHSIRRRAIATVGVLAVLLAGAATLRAAIGERAPRPPLTQLSTAGSISISNSDDGAAIFTLAGIAPGESGQGEVTIGNTGSAPGALTLASLGLSDAPGLYGGALSERLKLRIVDLSAAGQPEAFAGSLAAMPELQLGILAAGESRTYRFVVAMLDGGPPSTPFVDDNVYQRASASLGYRWTLTEVGGSQPEGSHDIPISAGVATPDAATPPSHKHRPNRRRVGGARGESLVGSSLDDVIFGRGGADRILGKRGQDYLVGGLGVDRIHGGPAADRVRGGVDPDRLYGGVGDDAIFARDGDADLIDCGSGHDIAYVDERDRAKGCESTPSRYARLFSLGE